MYFWLLLIALGVLGTDGDMSRADSTHLWFQHGNDALIFYNDVVVQETFAATYFCAIGFNHGYFGIQHVTKQGRKQAIFSLWDVVDQEGRAANDDLASAVQTGSGVKLERFGGEGTGWKTTYPFNWKVGDNVQFLVKVKPGQNGYVHYTGLIYDSAKSQWKLMATLKRIDDYKLLKGYYSFLEDWLGGDGDVAREASFDPWVKVNGTGKWAQSKTAQFTRTGTNPNVNAWVADGRFFMRTGGKTTNDVAAKRNQLARNVNDTLPAVLNNIDNIINNQQYLP